MVKKIQKINNKKQQSTVPVLLPRNNTFNSLGFWFLMIISITAAYTILNIYVIIPTHYLS